MNFNQTFFNVIEEQNILKTTKTKPIVDAIKSRKKVDFYYSGPRKGRNSVKSGKRESAELVAIGLSKKGNLIVRAYVDTPSVSKKGFEKTNWRTFMVSRMSDVKISDEKFDQKRPDYEEGADMSMSVTYVKSDWTNKPEVKKSRIVKPTVTKPTPKPVQPQPTEPQPVEPEVKPTEPTEPTPTELPQPTPQTKPTKTPTPPKEPTQPTPEEPKTQELPQPKPQEKPEVNPEEDENKKLQESIKNIKRLMFS
jgi:hypothetical protein